MIGAWKDLKENLEQHRGSYGNKTTCLNDLEFQNERDKINSENANDDKSIRSSQLNMKDTEVEKPQNMDWY